MLALALRKYQGGSHTRHCLSNLHQLGQSLALYAQDYDQCWPAITHSPAIRGGILSGTETPTVPYTFQLEPYIHDESLYACPEDNVPRKEGELWDGRYKGKLLKRSYALTGPIVTQQAAGAAGQDKSTSAFEYVAYQQKKYDRNTGIAGRSFASADNPAQTIALVENWGYRNSVLDGELSNAVLGSNWKDVLFGCDTASLPGRRIPAENEVDRFAPCTSVYDDQHNIPAQGHADVGNYLMADGHVESLQWTQAREADFQRFKLHK